MNCLSTSFISGIRGPAGMGASASTLRFNSLAAIAFPVSWFVAKVTKLRTTSRVWRPGLTGTCTSLASLSSRGTTGLRFWGILVLSPFSTSSPRSWQPLLAPCTLERRKRSDYSSGCASTLLAVGRRGKRLSYLN